LIYYDCETVGLHGVPVLIQWARDDGPINLHSVWTEHIKDTMTLIEMMMDEGVIGFNMAFDHFHLSKIYTMFSLALEHYGNIIPVDWIDELAMLEPEARDGVCLRPSHCFDLMLHARKGPYQGTMDRDDIRIKRVPTALAYELCQKLTELVKLPDIYFSRTHSKKQWHVVDIEDETDFKDVVLKFAASSALKALAVDTGIAKEGLLVYKDVEVSEHFKPVEYGFAPFALAGLWNKKRKKVIRTDIGKWLGTWPAVINEHIIHWAYNELARKYAELDVHYTRELYKFFGCPPVDDDDSVLACAVASNRWKGFTIDSEGIKKLREEAFVLATRYSFVSAPEKVKYFLGEVMDDTEKLILDSTKKQILEEIVKWELDDGTIHPAAGRAKLILESRGALEEVKIYDKLLMAGRFHASFKVIGTLSSRMSGSDGLNPQGIKRTKNVRKQFFFATKPMILSGGDFDSFEVTLADAEYNDPKLREILLSGKKIQAIFGEYLYSGMEYDEILESKGEEKDYYTPAKSGFLAVMYGGEAFTLETRLGIATEQAEEAYRKFMLDFPNIRRARQKVFDMFCSMKQPKGIGTKVEWHEPAEFIDSMLGFRRYFTLENKITRALFNLAENPPKQWKELKIKVTRREREQTVSGAVQSALFGAAFGIQSACMRAACNHRIQSTGAQITKNLQRNIWELQPIGIHEWKIQCYNGHDEIMACHPVEISDEVKTIVQSTIRGFCDKIPLLKMEWKQNLSTWADK
jgi:hypothetical protein